jgi:hypothetical protein
MPLRLAYASSIARRLRGDIRSPCISHMQAQVSRSRRSVIFGRPALADRLRQINAFDRFHQLGQRTPKAIRLRAKRDESGHCPATLGQNDAIDLAARPARSDPGSSA